jgi:signal transduction histidine kinase
VRSYFYVSVVLIAGGLVSAGLLEIYFRHSESLEQVQVAQQEAASRAALQIEQFIRNIATTMKAFTKNADPSFPVVFVEYEFELRRLLFLAPAITEALVTDGDGIIRAQVSRFRAVAPLLKKDLSQTTAFRESRQGRAHFGAVYFRDSDPFLSVSVPIEELPGEVVGVLQAETSLRDILDVVSAVRFGAPGYRYVMTRSGDLIAHSNIRTVSQRRDLAALSQVKAAFRSGTDLPTSRATTAYNTEREKVFSSHALIPILDWAIFIERPVREAYAPIYASLFRTSILLLIGLFVAIVATLFVSRRVVRPLETLRRGVERIRQGDLSTRLDVSTGDELQILSDEFNEMAANLKEAYTGLERKVAERTQELTTANLKLAEASRHKSEFLANVNHELRTPVSAIIGYSRLLLRETEDQIDALQRANLQDLLHNAERLLHEIDSLLDLAKIEAGKMEVRLEPVRVQEVIQDALCIIEPLLNGGAVRLSREISPRIPVLNADREKLRHIVLNLLDNAVKFTDRGEITISAFQEDASLRVVVADTGIGIHAEDLSRIFEEFHRARSSSNRRYRGTGLGLAIVKRSVDLLGGTVAVESELGKGSRFTVVLPFRRTGIEPHNRREPTA